MAESEATTQFRELQKRFMDASRKLKQARGAPRHAQPRTLAPAAAALRACSHARRLRAIRTRVPVPVPCCSARARRA